MGKLLLRSVLIFALLAGPACKAADAPAEVYQAYAYNGNVIPAPTPATLASASVVVAFNFAGVGYSYSVLEAPSGTIDSIALYQAAPGDPLPASAIAMLCGSAAACTAVTGFALLVPPATAATLGTVLRANGAQAVVFTTTAQKAAGGAMRGTMQLIP